MTSPGACLPQWLRASVRRAPGAVRTPGEPLGFARRDTGPGRPAALQQRTGRKAAGSKVRSQEELDHAVRQIISRAVVSEGVVDIFAPGLEKPDISILSEEFLAEVLGMPQRNLAVELLQKLLKGEIAALRRKNVVQARSFVEMLEQTLGRY